MSKATNLEEYLSPLNKRGLHQPDLPDEQLKRSANRRNRTEGLHRRVQAFQ